MSRAELQRWIEHGRVTVGGRARKASDKVREGDVVEVEPEAPRALERRARRGGPFEVLYVDDAVVVVNKPPGVVVHPARGHEGGTLVNGLLALGLFDAAVLEGDEATTRRGTCARGSCTGSTRGRAASSWWRGRRRRARS